MNLTPSEPHDEFKSDPRSEHSEETKAQESPEKLISPPPNLGLEREADRIIRTTPELLRRIVSSVSDILIEQHVAQYFKITRPKDNNDPLEVGAATAITAVLEHAHRLFEIFYDEQLYLASTLHELPNDDAVRVCLNTVQPLLGVLHNSLRAAYLALPSLLNSTAIQYSSELGIPPNFVSENPSQLHEVRLNQLRHSVARLAGLRDLLDAHTNFTEVVAQEILFNRYHRLISYTRPKEKPACFDVPAKHIAPHIGTIIDEASQAAAKLRNHLQYHLALHDVLEFDHDDETGVSYFAIVEYLTFAPLVEIAIVDNTKIVMHIPLPNCCPGDALNSLEHELKQLAVVNSSPLASLAGSLTTETRNSRCKVGGYLCEQSIVVTVDLGILPQIDPGSINYPPAEDLLTDEDEPPRVIPLTAISGDSFALQLRAIPRVTSNGARYSVVLSNSDILKKFTTRPYLLQNIDKVIESDDRLNCVLLLENEGTPIYPETNQDSPDYDETVESDTEMSSDDSSNEFSIEVNAEEEVTDVFPRNVCLSFRILEQSHRAKTRASFIEAMTTIHKVTADTYLQKSPSEQDIHTLYPHRNESPQILIPGETLENREILDTLCSFLEQIPTYSLTMFYADDKDLLTLGHILDFFSEERLRTIRKAQGEVQLLLSGHSVDDNGQWVSLPSYMHVTTRSGEVLYNIEVLPLAPIHGDHHDSLLKFVHAISDDLTEILNASYNEAGRFQQDVFTARLGTVNKFGLPEDVINSLVQLGRCANLFPFGQVRRAAVANYLLYSCGEIGMGGVDKFGNQSFYFPKPAVPPYLRRYDEKRPS